MPAYYNEYDAGAAAWLRELIRRGLIADGEVDERSILDVTADDLRGFTQCHFFAGIGGWSYALRLAGWPDDQPVWTGSPPCQPFSTAGQQKGQDDERHLAPHFATLVAAGRPPILFGEQVASAVVFGKPAKRAEHCASGQPEWAWIDDLFGRLEAAHYACGAADLPAAGVGAFHIRQRTFFGAVRLADTDNTGPQRWLSGRQDQGREDQSRHSGCGSAVGGLADADRGGCKPWQRDDQAARHGHPAAATGGNGGLADAESIGRIERGADAGGMRSRDGAERLSGRSAINGSMERVERPSALHGGWADADWLFCRDGKWRPVEPASQRMANGISLCLGSLRDLGCSEIEEEVRHAAHCAEFGDEVLRMLRDGHDPQEVWFALGRRFGFPVSTLLFAVLCKHQRELGFFSDSAETGSAQDGWAFVREMRGISSQAACASQGCELGQQFSEKLGDALSKLPQDSAPYRQLVGLIASYNAGPLAHGLPARVVRLRGYGNAIVPQAAAAFIKTFCGVIK